MKDHAFLHRAHKRMDRLPRGHVLAMVLFVLLAELLLFLFHQPLLDRYIATVARLAAECGVTTSVLRYPFLPPVIKDFPVLESVFNFPDTLRALMNFIAGVLVIAIVPHLRRLWKPLRIYLVYLALLNATSAAFFLIWPERFPYNVAEFSQLYVGVQLGIWFMIPLVMGLVLLPVPAAAGEKMLVILAVGIWAAVFGIVRYASFLYILEAGSAIYMAVMFFALGPFLDFVYMVAIYSIYLNIVALRVQDSNRMWRWSF